jgi:hypothetical protein
MLARQAGATDNTETANSNGNSNNITTTPTYSYAAYPYIDHCMIAP